MSRQWLEELNKDVLYYTPFYEEVRLAELFYEEDGGWVCNSGLLGIENYRLGSESLEDARLEVEDLIIAHFEGEMEYSKYRLNCFKGVAQNKVELSLDVLTRLKVSLSNVRIDGNRVIEALDIGIMALEKQLKGDLEMKCFEFNDPVYALIRAETMEKAEEIYWEEVVVDTFGVDKSIYKPEELYAYIAFTRLHRALSDTHNNDEVIEVFENPENHILLIDSGLE